MLAIHDAHVAVFSEAFAHARTMRIGGTAEQQTFPGNEPADPLQVDGKLTGVIDHDGLGRVCGTMVSSNSAPLTD
jgi:hypothetical protein